MENCLCRSIQKEPYSKLKKLNNLDKDCCNYLNFGDFFKRVFDNKEARTIKIDCDRDFKVGSAYGEVVEVIPFFRTVLMVFMYEQGWGMAHTFDEVVWE